MPARDFIKVFLETDPGLLVNNLRIEHPELDRAFRNISDGMPEAKMYPIMASFVIGKLAGLVLTASIGENHSGLQAMPGDNL